MSDFLQSAVINGTSFALMGRTFTFDNGFLGYVSLFNGEAADSYTFNITFAGGDWTISTLRFTGSNIDINLSDAGGAGQRTIDYLRLAPGESTVDMGNTRARHIQGGGEEDVTLTLGSQRTTSVELYGGDDVVTGGSGDIGRIALGEGNNRVVTGIGRIESIIGGSGNDLIRVIDGGRILSALMSEGDDVVVIEGSGRIDQLRGFSEGTQRLTMSGTSRANMVMLDGEEVTVTLTEEARIFALKLGEGVNKVSSQAWLESFYSHDGTNTLTFGAGGAGQIFISGDGGLQTIRAQGWVGSINLSDETRAAITLTGGGGSVRTSSGDDRFTAGAGFIGTVVTADGQDVLTFGAGGAGYVETGADNDRVTTGAGFVGTITAGSGNDVVTIGSGGASTIRMGDGDDLVVLSALTVDNFVILQGGFGSDTLDLSRMGAAVSVDLAGADFQDVAGGRGWLSVFSFENLTGTTRNDTLIGNDVDNSFRGGKGKDTLTGGNGVDSFLFGKQDGADTITDFEIGTDKLDFIGAAGLGALKFSRADDDVLVKFGKTSVLVEDVTLAELRDDANFLF